MIYNESRQKHTCTCQCVKRCQVVARFQSLTYFIFIRHVYMINAVCLSASRFSVSIFTGNWCDLGLDGLLRSTLWSWEDAYFIRTHLGFWNNSILPYFVWLVMIRAFLSHRFAAPVVYLQLLKAVGRRAPPATQAIKTQRWFTCCSVFYMFLLICTVCRNTLLTTSCTK